MKVLPFGLFSAQTKKKENAKKLRLLFILYFHSHDQSVANQR